MDLANILEQLERAANVVLAPPNVVSNEERFVAQNIIQRFKEQRDISTFHLCQLILEKSRNELVLHETAQVLRKTLQLRWAEISIADINSLCEKLIAFIFNTPTLSYGIHRRLATVLALIVKRDFVLREGKKCVELIQFLEPLFHGPTLSPVCSIIDALLAEHQFVTDNDDPVLSFEMHTTAKREFETTSFLRIFQLCLSFLHEFNNIVSRNSDDSPGGEGPNYVQVKQFELILSLLESIFSWNFSSLTLTKRLASIIERDSSARWKPPPNWKSTILNPNCFQIIFETYHKFRYNENFLIKIINIITQFLSIHGPILNSEGYYGFNGSSSVEFLNHIMPHLNTIIEVTGKSPSEALALSDVLRKLLIYHRPAVLNCIESGTLEKFLSLTATFSHFIIQQGVTEEANCALDDRMYREATSRILDMWTCVISDVDAFPRETLQPIAKNLFNAFVLGRLSPPEGTRLPSDVLHEEILDDEEESDEIQFRDQLEIIGFIGRYVLSHSLPFMNNLLAFKIQSFQRLMESGATQASSPGSIAAATPAQTTSFNKESLLALNEDLHWTVLIAGELISFEAVGEMNLIPPEINQLSIEAASNPQISNQALQNALHLQSIPDEVDPVMKLVYQILTLLEMETRLIESNLSYLLSPTVATNILWFFERWASIYFIFIEDHYAAISEAFSSGWGEGSPIVAEIQTLLLNRIRLHLVSFIGEDALTAQAIGLLYSLVSSQKKAKMALKSPGLTPLIDLLNHIGCNSTSSPMSNTRYQKFVRSLTVIGTHCSNEEERRSYFNRIIGPILTRFQNLSQLIRSGGDKHRDDIRQELISVFHGFIGVALSSQSRCAAEIFAALSIPARECGIIISTYNNYNEIVDLCLEFITALGKHSLSYLPRAESYCLYESASNVVKAYAHHANGRHSSERTAEEDTYNDLLMLMEMLFCLMTKDLLDFSPEATSTLTGNDANNDDLQQPKITASDVCLEGLRIILPLMNVDLIQYPTLSGKYFKLISYISELHAEKVLEVQPWMLEALFRSVDLGLQKSVPDDFSHCCEFIGSLTSQIGKHPQAYTHVASLTMPFLKTFLQMLLSHNIGKDYMAPFSSTLFALISMFQDTFQELAQEIIRSCSTEAKRTVMEDGFRKLTENLNLRNGGDRASRVSFRDRLEVFIFSVSGTMN